MASPDPIFIVFQSYFNKLLKLLVEEKGSGGGQKSYGAKKAKNFTNSMVAEKAKNRIALRRPKSKYIRFFKKIPLRVVDRILKKFREGVQAGRESTLLCQSVASAAVAN